MRIFLDTNLFITGASEDDSPESKVLDFLGFDGTRNPDVIIVVCTELLDQIKRVSRRHGGRNFTSILISQFWYSFTVDFVFLDEEEIELTKQAQEIPREDVEIFLGAKNGNVDYFVSANHKLIKAIAERDELFVSLTPQAFLEKLENNEL